MGDLDELKSERTRIRRSFSKVSKKLDGLLLKEDRTDDDLTEISSLMELLDLRNSELEDKNSLILTAMKLRKSPEKDMNAEQDKVDEILMSFLKYKAAVGKLLNPVFPDDDKSMSGASVHSESSSKSSGKHKKYKLPVLQLHKSGGELKDWLPFWSQFSKFDQDDEMDDDDKLGYLAQCMVEGSPAKALVDSYPASGKMYASVVEALKGRYARDDLLTEFYIRELLQLVIRNSSAHDKPPISVLYDQLQSHLRNLELLGVTIEKYAAILMPMVSSCLPGELYRVWDRSYAPIIKAAHPAATSKDFLENLMEFLRSEVEGDQKLALSRTSFGLAVDHSGGIPGAQAKTGNPKKQQKESELENTPTAAGLLTTAKSADNPGCLFCGAKHNPRDCKAAVDLSLEQRREKVTGAKACFCCLQRNHLAKQCRNRPKCVVCKRGHFVLMCDQLTRDSATVVSPKHDDPDPAAVNDEVLTTVSSRCSVLMQTLVVSIRGTNGHSRRARLLIDSASHRSYVLSKTAKEMGYLPCHQETMQHSLFGGGTTGIVTHNVFRLHLSKLDETYRCNFEVLEQSKICGPISAVTDGPWIQELAAHNVRISDTGMETDIEILVGADVAAKLWTGRRIPLSSGLVAMETSLGWTLSGKVPSNSGSPTSHVTLASVVTCMLTKEATITDLWTLDTLGILDPTEKSSRTEIEAATQQHFLDTVQVVENGRFEVHLPWVENHPPLPDNYQPSLKRLQATVRRLKAEGYYEAYQALLDEWLEEEVIEEVPFNEVGLPCHYLPHRHVVKANSTTPVRPVFDASSRENHNPSLNQCLEKGPNLIEKIPAVLARFRLKRVAVVGDIRRAFLQIGVCQRDRNFLRFLWIDQNGVLKMYRHRRVVFGVSPSPFLLESCIKYHLDSTLALCREGKSDWPVSFIELLANSFYVDNCLASLDDENQAREFIDVSSKVLAERQFELRGWEQSGETCTTTPTNVLGLLWHKEEDVLAINLESLMTVDNRKVTKKVMLSAAHRIFDPIGIFCAVALTPKLLVQQTWEMGLSWEQEVCADLRGKYLDWFEEVPLLAKIRIPRWVSVTNIPDSNWTLHVFSDACQTSYAAAIFLRVEHEDEVIVRLVAAKARVAPTAKPGKGMTIPRLELLAASIAARLYSSVARDYNLPDVRTIFWTDATTILAWIQRNEPWDVFVMNRIKEIRDLTEGCEWRHVPGHQNPADLPSRGCSPKKFLASQWWEGPAWLKAPESSWPQSPEDFNEDEISQERRKNIVSSMVNSSEDGDWFYRRFSHYKMIVRTIGWIYRYRQNAKIAKDQRIHQDLSAEEYTLAEYKVLSMVQERTLKGLCDPRLASLLPFFDKHGLIRIMTKISYRSDINDFRHPIVLSTEHPVIIRLIMDMHLENCHAGVHMLISLLRQQFWILGGRRAIRNVLNSCIRCKRYVAKRIESQPIPLPEPRVRNAKIFEICGVDLAGPLYLKSGKGATEKGYICLFTCAVYRAVHLELLSSQSTDSFIQGFRRFMSRRGRPGIMYSDQGSNFVGFENAMKQLDWEEIYRYSSVRKIDWRFNPPSSPWWGGWWERLIGVLKQLLRRVLGRASLGYEEMQTILCDCEAVINSRPITYLSDNPKDLTPLTPSMFLQDVEEIGVPDLDLIEAKDLRKRLQYRQKLTETLRERFRDEYLGQLKLSSTKGRIREVVPGEIVLIGDDKTARLDWPLGRVTNVIEGADGNVRVATVRTASGELSRPVQRLYPLELNFQLDKDDQVTSYLQNVLKKDKGTSEVSSSAEDETSGLCDVTPLPPGCAVPIVDEESTEEDESSAATMTRHGRVTRKPQRLDL